MKDSLSIDSLETDSEVQPLPLNETKAVLELEGVVTPGAATNEGKEVSLGPIEGSWEEGSKDTEPANKEQQQERPAQPALLQCPAAQPRRARDQANSQQHNHQALRGGGEVQGGAAGGRTRRQDPGRDKPGQNPEHCQGIVDRRQEALGEVLNQLAPQDVAAGRAGPV